MSVSTISMHDFIILSIDIFCIYFENTVIQNTEKCVFKDMPSWYAFSLFSVR